MTEASTDFVLQQGDKERIVFNKAPFVITESGLKFTPEFERDAHVDSIVLDWQHTVEEAMVFGEKYKFKDTRFKPLISLLRIFGIERRDEDPVQNRLIEILSAETPNILLIHGHGAEKQGRWIISTKGFGEETVDVEDFLTGPIKDLTSKNGIYINSI